MSEKETELPENWEDEIDWGEEEEESSPPEAASTDEAPAEAPLPFHNVTPVKLAVLSFVTLGLYPLVWFYKNWVTFSRYRDGAPRRAVAGGDTDRGGAVLEAPAPAYRDEDVGLEAAIGIDVGGQDRHRLPHGGEDAPYRVAEGVADAVRGSRQSAAVEHVTAFPVQQAHVILPSS